VRLAAVLALFSLALGSVLVGYSALCLHGLLGAPPDLDVDPDTTGIHWRLWLARRRRRLRRGFGRGRLTPRFGHRSDGSSS